MQYNVNDIRFFRNSQCECEWNYFIVNQYFFPRNLANFIEVHMFRAVTRNQQDLIQLVVLQAYLCDKLIRAAEYTKQKRHIMH